MSSAGEPSLATLRLAPAPAQAERLGAAHEAGQAPATRGSLERFSRMALVALAVLYVVLRAALIPIVHDEAVTYFAHVPLGVLQIVEHRGVLPSNNHLLNTLLMKVSVGLFGPRSSP